MDEKYIWPLIGVFLGWFLNALKDSAKSRIENKKVIARLLTKLIRVESQVSILLSTCEYSKRMFKSSKEYEEFRVGIVDRHFLMPNEVSHDLKESIDAFALLYPLLAMDFELTYQSILTIKSVNMIASSNSDDMYKPLLEAHELNTRLCKEQLQKHISSVAFKHGIFTLLRLRVGNAMKRKGKKTETAKRELAKVVMDIEDMKSKISVI